MHFVVILCCLLGKATADSGSDFVNNLFSDLAPILALFGERVTQQFMSQSTGWADHILLAMAPLGIITAIVGAIRVGGPPWLKAVIGRARENFAVVESELLSSTSSEVCEVWNGREIVRIMGTPPITEFICLVPKSEPYLYESSGKPMHVQFMTMDDALGQGFIESHFKSGGQYGSRNASRPTLKVGNRRKWLQFFGPKKTYAADEEALPCPSEVGQDTAVHECEMTTTEGDRPIPSQIHSTSLGAKLKPTAQMEIGDGFGAVELGASDQSRRSSHLREVNDDTEIHLVPPQDETNRSHNTDPEPSFFKEEHDRSDLSDLLEAVNSNSYYSYSSYSNLTDDSSSGTDPVAAIQSHSNILPSQPTVSLRRDAGTRPGGNSTVPVIEPVKPSEPATLADESPDIIIIRNNYHTTPNIIMNCNSFHRGSLRLAAAFGTFLQVTLIIYFAGTVYYWKMEPDGKPVRNYGFPFAAAGSITLVVGMMICAHVVESYTEEDRYTVGKDRTARMIWLQQKKKVGEQVFGSCALYPADAQQTIITSRKKLSSRPLSALIHEILPKGFGEHRLQEAEVLRKRPANEKHAHSVGDFQGNRHLGDSMTVLEAKTFLGVALALLGFFFQFTGFRALHWSVALTQLGAIGIMTTLRVAVRRGFSRPPIHYDLMPGHELDWLAMTLQHSDTLPWGKKKMELHLETEKLGWGVATGLDLQEMRGLDVSTCLKRVVSGEFKSQQSGNIDTVLPLRRDLAEACDWNGATSALAIQLARSMDAVIKLFLNELAFPFDPAWEILLRPRVLQPSRHARVHIRLGNDGWQVQADEIDAALSLWIFSTKMPYEWPTLQQESGSYINAGIEKNDSWFRAKGASSRKGLHIVGESTEAMLKDFDWWLPDAMSELVDVRVPSLSGENVPKRTSSFEDVFIEETFPRDCITGRSSAKIRGEPPATSPTDPGQSLGVNWDIWPEETDSTKFVGPKRIKISIRETQRFKALLQNGKTTLDSDEASDEPSAHLSRPKNLLALRNNDSLDRNFARELFGSFVWAIAENIDDCIPGEVAVERRDSWNERFGRGLVSQTGNLEFDIELRHFGLSKLMEEIQAQGFASSEQLHYLLIAPLSFFGKLPSETSVVTYIEGVARTLSNKVWYFEEESALYVWLLYSCSVATTTPSSDASVRAVAVVVEHLRRVSDDMRAMELQEITLKDDATRSTVAGNTPHRNRQSDKYRTIVFFYETIRKVLKMVSSTAIHAAEATNEWHRTKWCLGEKTIRTEEYSQGEYQPQIIPDRQLNIKAIKDVEDPEPSTWTSSVDGLDRVSIAQTDLFGWNVLHYIASGRHFYFDDAFMPDDDLKQAAGDEDLNGWIPLHWACSRGHRNLAEGLIKLGSDINHAGRDGRTPLHCAAENNRLSAATTLIEFKAMVDRQDKTGNTPVFWAAYKGHPAMFRLLFQLEDSQRLCSGGRTLLHAAAIGRCRKIVTMICEDKQGRIDKSAEDDDLMTALDYAQANDDVKMMRYLLQMGATSPRGLREPIKVTIEKRREKMLRLQQKRVRDSPGLIERFNNAVQQGRARPVQIFINQFGCDVNTSFSGNDNPLHTAARYNNMKMLRLLVLHYGADVNIKDESGASALDKAITSDAGRAVKYLCSVGAELSPGSLRRALETRSYHSAQELLKAGVEVDNECFEIIKTGRRKNNIERITRVLRHFQQQN